MAIYYESSLCHHGIKGQKWGVRRFQNEDGSLTSAGRRHTRAERKEAKNEVKRLIDERGKVGSEEATAKYHYRNSPTDANYNKWVKSSSKYREINSKIERLAKEYDLGRGARRSETAAGVAFVGALAALPVMGLLASLYGKH